MCGVQGVQAQVATETNEFGGYVRAGGVSSSNGSAGVYTLGLPMQGFTLGNTRDLFALLFLRHNMEIEGGRLLTLGLTPSYWSESSSLNRRGKYRTAQSYVEYGGVAKNSTKVWAGRRLLRSDVHIVDTYYIDYGGYSPDTNDGIGVRNVQLGEGGMLGLSLYQGSSRDVPTSSGRSPIRGVVDIEDIKFNAGGALRFVLSANKGDFEAGKSGVAWTVQHDQRQIYSSDMSNMLAYQRSVGCAALDHSFGPSSFPIFCGEAYRIMDAVTWQAGRFGGQGFVMHTGEWANNGGETRKGAAIGARLSYDFASQVKFLAEGGFLTYTKPDEISQKLSKATVAISFGMEPGFWSRPELRLFLSHYRWNEATRQANSFRGKGDTTFGMQFETWWGSSM